MQESDASQSKDPTTESQKVRVFLEESEKLYKQRKLDQAMEPAQKALGFAEDAVLEECLFSCVLQLAKILIKKAEYSGDNSFSARALSHVKKARASQSYPHLYTKYLLYAGQANHQQKEQQAALSFFETALSFNQSRGNSTGTIRSLNALSSYYINHSTFDKALELTSQAMNMAEKLNDIELLVLCYKNLSICHARKRALDESLACAEKLKSYSSEIEDTEGEAIALNVRAITCFSRGEYKEALENFTESLQKSEAIDFRPNMAKCLINIGIIFSNLYNYQESQKHYKKVLKGFRDTIEPYTLIAILYNMGLLGLETKSFDKAEMYFWEGLSLAKKYQNEALAARLLSQLGLTYTLLNDMKLALHISHEAETLYLKLGNTFGSQINFINLGGIYKEMNQPDKALSYLLKGIDLAKEKKHIKSMMRAYKMMSELYKENKEYEKAFEFLEAYNLVFEKDANERRDHQVMDLEIQYETREKEKEIELLTQENHYQSQLLEKSEQISQQNEKLRVANEEIRQFTYAVGHDIKQPMRMIGEYSDILLRKYKNEFDEDANEYFGYITNGVSNLTDMVNDLLKYARLGSDSLVVEKVDMNDVLPIVLNGLYVQIRESQAKVIYDKLPVVATSKVLVGQLLQNLISNAIKFRGDRKPLVTVWIDENEAEWIVGVKDNGIGIKLENQKRIFEIFRRLHSTVKYEGTGIGLAVCQKIAGRLGGRIWVQSEFGKGSTFYFSLPKTEK